MKNNKKKAFEKECNEEIDKIFSALETEEDLFNKMVNEIETNIIDHPQQSFIFIILKHIAKIEAHLIGLNHMEVWIKEKLEEINK